MSGLPFLPPIAIGSDQAHYLRQSEWCQFDIEIGNGSWIYTDAEVSDTKMVEIQRDCPAGYHATLKGRHELSGVGIMARMNGKRNRNLPCLLGANGQTSFLRFAQIRGRMSWR